MFAILSTRYVDYLIAKNKLDPAKKEYYVCGQEVRIEQTVFLLCVFLLSIPFGAWRESIVFIAVLRMLRSHTGGYHASSVTTCLFLSFGIVVAGYIALPYAAALSIWILAAIALLSAAVIWVYAPLNHPSYCGSEIEMAYHAKKSKQYVGAALAGIAIMAVVPLPNLFAWYAAYALAVTAVLIVLAKLAGQVLDS